MTLLANQRPATTAPLGLNPWAPANFNLLTNGRRDVRNTVRNAQRYSDRLEQQVRSTSAVLQSHWLDGSLVTTAGWRRDQVWSFDAGIPGITPLGTADVRWEVFPPKLTRTVSDTSGSWGIVGHAPGAWRRWLLRGSEISVFYNHATNFRVAPQRYTITRQSLPSESGTTTEYGIRFAVFDGKLELRLARYETMADHATVNGLTAALNQLAMMVPQVVDHNYLGENADNPAGIAGFEAWLDSPSGRTYREAFSVMLTPPAETAGRPPSQYGNYADATADRGQINGVSTLRSTGIELELTCNPTPTWRILAHAASAEAGRTRIAPELFDFIFKPGGVVSLVQNPDGTPTPAGRLIGSPIGAGATPLQSFINSNVVNLGLVTSFAQEGTRTDELRKWNFRLVTDYSFDGETWWRRLKGFNVGGAVRWSDRPLLGYAGRTTSIGGVTLVTSDLGRPYYGATETIYDGWIGYRRNLGHGVAWKIQLNVRNLGVGNELRPLAVWPDGKVIQWTIREPQRWTLTNTFTF
jgi:hypothetical protein